MQCNQQNKLISDLDLNLDKWRQESDDLVRKINGGNSSTTITLEVTGELRVRLSGEHEATHYVKPSFFQRRSIKRAINRAKDRILDSALSKLGS